MMRSAQNQATHGISAATWLSSDSYPTRPGTFLIKTAVLSVLVVALLAQAHAEETPYRTALNSVRERYQALDIERNDYRKSKPGLPAAQEDEYRRILGQLLIDDPVWALIRELQADIDALVALRSRTPEDRATLESLKDLLAVVAAIEERASTRQEAEKYATALRQFIARRDVAGARNWINSQ